MKYLILTLIGLVVLLTLASCGLVTINTTIGNEAIAEEYGGIYVFDKKLRDEIIEREKKIKEVREVVQEASFKLQTSYFGAYHKEREKLLRNFFTEKEIQDYEDMIESNRKRGVIVSYSYHPIYQKSIEIYEELVKKYPRPEPLTVYDQSDIINKTYPRILSNGCRYIEADEDDYPLILTPPSPRKLEDKDIELIERIREYMGEEAYEKYFAGVIHQNIPDCFYEEVTSETYRDFNIDFEKIFSTDFEKIKEYMGEEVYEKYFVGEDDVPIRFHSFKRRTTLGWLYVKGGKPIVISMSASGLKKLKTTYGPLTGDEGAGFKYVHKDYSKKLSNNIFYLENGKFIKSDEIRKGERK